MAKTMAMQLFVRVVIWVLWPVITIALAAMGLTPEWFWGLLLGPEWQTKVPQYLTQDYARWAAVLVAIGLGVAYLYFRFRKPQENPIANEVTNAELLWAQAELERQKRLTLKEQRAASASPPKPSKQVRKQDTPATVPPSRHDNDGPIKWKFTKPYSVFGHSRGYGEGVWIDGFQIHGRNSTDHSLMNIKASVRPFVTHEQMSLFFVINGQQVKPEDTAGIPPHTDFTIGRVLPAEDPQRTQGIPADRFLVKYGGFRFSFSYECDGNSSNYTTNFSLDDVRTQISVIEEQTRSQVTPQAVVRKREGNDI